MHYRMPPRRRAGSLRLPRRHDDEQSRAGRLIGPGCGIRDTGYAPRSGLGYAGDSGYAAAKRRGYSGYGIRLVQIAGAGYGIRAAKRRGIRRGFGIRRRGAAGIRPGYGIRGSRKIPQPGPSLSRRRTGARTQPERSHLVEAAHTDSDLGVGRLD